MCDLDVAMDEAQGVKVGKRRRELRREMPPLEERTEVCQRRRV